MIVVGIDPSARGKIGYAEVTERGALILLDAFAALDDVREAVGRLPGDALVAIEEPLLFAPRSAQTARALWLRAGQLVEIAERAGLEWLSVPAATWKAARGIAPNLPTAEAKAASIRLARLALGPQASLLVSADAADAFNLALYAAGARRLKKA
jgi:hypothetical protein